LLANAVGHSPLRWLTQCLRGQARSYKGYPHDRRDICTTEGISARLKTRAKRNTCRSRLAGERGGPLTPSVADTMPSRASALLQRMPVRPKEYPHDRGDICTTEGISARLKTRAKRKTCRSRLAGERGGPTTAAVADTMPSRASALLQGMPVRPKGYLHRRRSICTTENPRQTQNCRSRLAGEPGGPPTPAMPDTMDSQQAGACTVIGLNQRDHRLNPDQKNAFLKDCHAIPFHSHH